MIAILVAAGASLALTFAMIGQSLWDRRQARRANQAWFDAHVGPGRAIQEGDELQ